MPSGSSVQSSTTGIGFMTICTEICPRSFCVTFALVFGILKNDAVSSARVSSATRRIGAESGCCGTWKCEPAGSPGDGGGGRFGRVKPRYTMRPLLSNPGVPNGPPIMNCASLGRGTAMTRATLPAPSITSIDNDAGSMNKLESPRYAISPAVRPLYAFAVAAVVSATTASCTNVESSNSSCRRTRSFTSTRPPGNGRTVEILPNTSLGEMRTTAPSGRTGGSVCASNGMETPTARTDTLTRRTNEAGMREPEGRKINGR